MVYYMAYKMVVEYLADPGFQVGGGVGISNMHSLFPRRWKSIESGLLRLPEQHLSTNGWIPSGPGAFVVSRLPDPRIRKMAKIRVAFLQKMPVHRA